MAARNKKEAAINLRRPVVRMPLAINGRHAAVMAAAADGGWKGLISVIGRDIRDIVVVHWISTRR